MLEGAWLRTQEQVYLDLYHYWLKILAVAFGMGEHQPAKLAAIEGHWENHPGASVPLILFGIPDMAAEATRYAVEIPRLGSLLLVLLGYSGLGISLWPNIIPPGIFIWEAAGPPQSLGFALVGALLIVPVILMYTAWGYGFSAARYDTATDTTEGNHG